MNTKSSNPSLERMPAKSAGTAQLNCVRRSGGIGAWKKQFVIAFEKLFSP
jgi:hypothetical protein